MFFNFGPAPLFFLISVATPPLHCFIFNFFYSQIAILILGHYFVFLIKSLTILKLYNYKSFLKGVRNKSFALYCTSTFLIR